MGRIMTTNDDAVTRANPEVWLYDAGTWRHIPDPIAWQNGDDVHERYAQAGYADPPFIDLTYPQSKSGGVGLKLWTRREPPECVIDIEGSQMSTCSVYVSRLPDALDLLARWSPLITISAPIADALGEWERQQAEYRRTRRGG
jgi:hypothetical protein